MNVQPKLSGAIAGFEAHAFDRDGYCMLQGLAPADMVARFEADIALLAEQQLACRGITPQGDREPLVDLFKLGGGYRKLLYQAIHQMPILSEISQHVFQQLCHGGVLQSLGFGSPLLTQGIRVDIPNETDFMLPMHQDYAHLWSPRCVRIWLPLRPVGPGVGSMSIVPGSHAQGFVPHNMTDPKYPFLDPDTYDPAQEVVLKMPAGDGILFSPFLFHASQHNVGDRIKFVMAVHIQDGASLVDPDDPEDPVVKMMDIHHRRSAARDS